MDNFSPDEILAEIEAERLSQYQLLEWEVVSIEGKIPKIAMNINDPDYAQKSADESNFHHAAAARLPGKDWVTSIIISDEEYATLKAGDKITTLEHFSRVERWLAR